MSETPPGPPVAAPADPDPSPESDESTESTVSDDPEVKSWGWHLMQVTTWLLVVLLPIHVLSTWVFHDPGHFGVALYVDRWHHGVWRLFDVALVVATLLHGGVGLNGVLRRMTSNSAVRTVVAVVIGVVLGVVGALAVSTIVRFNVS